MARVIDIIRATECPIVGFDFNGNEIHCEKQKGHDGLHEALVQLTWEDDGDEIEGKEGGS